MTAPPKATVTPERARETTPGGIAGGWLSACLGAIAVGVVGFLLARGSEPQRAWMSVWMNFLYWTSVAMAGVVFGAVLQAAKGHWGKGFRRLAEAAGAFLPVSFLVFVLLYFGAEHVIPWLGEVETHHINRTWLAFPDVFIRDGALLLVLYLLSFVFLWNSLRADAPLVVDRLSGWRRALVSRIAGGWRGDEEEVERIRGRLARLSPVLILAWAFIFTILAIDFAMSLLPGFLSVIWGPYYFVGGWLSMLAVVAVAAHFTRRRYGLEDVWGKWEFHDLGKLIFAFCIFWTYLWFSQYLVIWYGNIPRETLFFRTRAVESFALLYWIQIALIFGLPFLLLLGRKPKMRSGWLAFVSVIILVGFWVERYTMVVPSVWEGGGVPLGWPELLISVGFVGLFGLCYALYASTFPKVPVRETIAVGSARRGP